MSYGNLERFCLLHIKHVRCFETRQPRKKLFCYQLEISMKYRVQHLRPQVWDFVISLQLSHHLQNFSFWVPLRDTLRSFHRIINSFFIIISNAVACCECCCRHSISIPRSTVPVNASVKVAMHFSKCVNFEKKTSTTFWNTILRF